MTGLKNIRIKQPGIVAASALLVNCVGALFSLLGLDSLSGLRITSLFCLSCAIPLLSYGISVELVINSVVNKNGKLHILFILIGAASGVFGIAAAIAHLSVYAAGFFVALCFLCVVLSKLCFVNINEVDFKN
ncbi:MAG: hypothetical protein FDZ69_14150 [Deltaproteobacteria bacterium]|nr:MAG: hypothetical protein FDZ69_14150 [Deltaproteobacteria bacterium]